MLGQALPSCEAPIWSTCDLVFELEPGDKPRTGSLVEIRAEFRSPHRDTVGIRGFQDTPGKWILRVSPNEAGDWDYRITSNIERLDGQLGKVKGLPSEDPGFIRVATVHHFQTVGDLKPHLWMGAYLDDFVAIPRADFDRIVKETAARKFNHLRVTLQADTDLHEAGERVKAINVAGLIVDLVLGDIPSGRREREEYITDIVAHFGAFNIVWSGIPAFEKTPQARNILLDAGTLIAKLDGYKHLQTTLAEQTSAPLVPDKWMQVLSYGTIDPNIAAVEHEFYQLPQVATRIKSRAELWNATMNGQYPAGFDAARGDAELGKSYQVWFEFMKENRHWELEPYYDLDGARSLAMHASDYRDNHFESVEYVAYLEKPATVEIAVEKHDYDVVWIDPATGERFPAKESKGDRFVGEPPPGDHDWVLRVSREGRKNSMLKSYKFDSRRVPVQEPEMRVGSTPFEIASPETSLSARVPPFFELKITKPSRATRNLLVEWTAEVGVEGFRIVGTGLRGTMELPEALKSRLPAVMSLHVSILNAYGKAYAVDRAVRMEP